MYNISRETVWFKNNYIYKRLELSHIVSATTVIYFDAVAKKNSENGNFIFQNVQTFIPLLLISQSPKKEKERKI